MGRINKSYLKQLAERKKFESGGLSTEGYRRDSPDVDNPYNVIPSNYISMDDVDFPIYAVSNAGDEDILYPGEERVFSGDYVTEFPLKNMGNKRYDQTGMYQLGGTNIDLKLPQFGEDKPRPFFEITGARTGPQYDMFGYGYIPLGKNLGISADLMRWKEGDWRGGGYGISGNINIPINRGERKIKPNVKEPVMFQGGGTMGIPGVNGQVVSSGPQPLSSVRRTRGPINKTKKGDVKTMSSKQVKQTLKYSKQKPNKI